MALSVVMGMRVLKTLRVGGGRLGGGQEETNAEKGEGDAEKQPR